MRAVLTKRLAIRGFIVSDFAAKQAEFLKDVSTWLRERRIKYREDVVEGLDKAPRALMGCCAARTSARSWCASRRRQ